jgi:hypothetical protein
VLDATVSALIESDAGAGVVGLLTHEGEPWATRCWGVRIVAHDPLQLRLLLPAGSLARLGRRAGAADRFPLALTVADVASLRSVQVKGTAHSLEAPTDDDLARFEVHCAALLEAINTTDGYPPELMVRWPPTDVVAATLDVDAVFDQTPGPDAGARLDGGAP